MDIFDKFFKKFSYKFEKGYPDFNYPPDVQLMKEILGNLGMKLPFELLQENVQDLKSLIQRSPLEAEFGPYEISGATTFKLTFAQIGNRGQESDSQRNEVYDFFIQMVNKLPQLSNPKKLAGGSSLGSLQFNYENKTYKIIVKGGDKGAAASSTSTDIKEGLVSLFYYAELSTSFNKVNFDGHLQVALNRAQMGVPGESPRVVGELVEWLEGLENSTQTINFINQPLSSALAIKEAYPKGRILRSGIFDTIRSKAQQLTGLPADKWNPGDLYVQIGGIDDGVITADNIEIINDAFVDQWGSTDKPLVSVSLKQADAQGGKAKALLDKFAQVKTDYNLNQDEINYTTEKYIQGIKRLRNQTLNLVNSNENIVYRMEGDNLKSDDMRFLRGKYAALKSIEFLFRQFPPDQVDEALVALVGFALSLTGLNPTFFKITAKKSGEAGSMDRFARGQNIILLNNDGDYEPIVITDSPTFGGLKINFKIEKGGKPYSVAVNARNNGNVQGTLEVQKIKALA